MTRTTLPIIALACLLLSAWVFADAAARISPRFASDRAVKTYELLEFDVALDRAYDNPFDPEQIAVDATFTGPEQRRVVVPAFWMERNDTRGFVVRFAAPFEGRWSATLSARDKEGATASDPLPFNVEKSSDPGFVRRSPGNVRYFEFDSGKPYFPIGLNLAWAGRGGAADYEKWFTKLSAHGGNFARVWMSHPSLMTETVEAGLGRYDQQACAFYDDVLLLAQKHGVYCMVTLNNYRDLRDRDNWGEATWPRFPYNAAAGAKGPATRPVDFITHPEAKRLHRQRLRYVAARYGAYTSVAVWELWNEQTFTQVDIPLAWTREMAAFLRDADPFDHLISTSFGENAQAEVWRLPGIDLTQTHLYPGESCEDSSTPVATAGSVHAEFGKPHLVGEFGIGAMGSDVKSDPAGVGTNLHNGIWSSLMSGSAGGAVVWWWNDYVDAKDLWHVFRAPAAFASRVEWTKRDFRPINVPPPTRSEGDTSEETFADLVVGASLGWGRSHGEPIEVLLNGQVARSLPSYLYGPEKKAYHTPTVLRVDLPRATKAVVRVAKASDHATLRSLLDGQPVRDFFFSALPGAEGQKSTERTEHKVFQAVFDRDCIVDVPAGRHELKLDVVGGDWITVDRVTFPAARSSRFADLHVYALQDGKTGETLAWLRDPASNWQNDRDGAKPRVVTGARVELPMKQAVGDVEFAVEWWDTRSGQVVKTERLRANDGRLTLTVPPVTRDVALRVVPASTAAVTPAAAASQ